MQQEIIASVDFGSKKLSASIATKNQDEEIEILGVKSCKSLGIEKGILKDIEKCRKSVSNLLKDLEDKTGKTIQGVSIGISSRKIRVAEITVRLTLEEEKVRSKDIVEALKKGQKSITIGNDESIIDVLINFYILDGKVIHKDILNCKGKDLELNLTLVIAQTKEIEKYYELFEGTKYKIQFFKLNIFSGKQVFLNEKNSIGDIVLVDIGAGNIDIALFSNGIPRYINNIPLGGNNISNDLAICGDCSFLEAENIKKTYSSKYKNIYNNESIEDIKVGTTEISKKLFYEVTNARIEEILNHINKELKNTGHYDRICSIILYGDGLSYFEDINEIVNNIFGIKTKVITKTDLGIKNSENITSLAIVKEVYDRLSLLGYNSRVQSDENIENENIKSEKVNELKKLDNKKLDNNEEKNHIFKKLIGFLNRIF